MASLNTYLTFNGNCEEAFNFYKTVFGSEIQYLGRFKDMPADKDGNKCPPGDEEKIMHVSLPVGKDSVLMGSDTGGEWGKSFLQGNNYTISINAESREEADNLFNGLSNGGNVIMPMNPTFWGDYFGMFADKFGVNWMVSFNEGKPMA